MDTQTTKSQQQLLNFSPPYTPDLPGLTLRGFQGEADYPNILQAINSSKDADGIQRSDTLEDIQRNYAHLHNCDPYRDMLFAEVDGRMAGYSRVRWEMQGDGKWIGFQLCFLDASQRGKGIGTALLKFNEERLRQIAQGLLDSGEIPATTPCQYDNFVFETENDRVELLENNGYQRARYAFDMVRPDFNDIPEAPIPDGLVVRTPRPEEYRKVWDASVEAFQDHWGYYRESDDEYYNWLEEPSFDPSLWRVAWDGDEVAGMVLSFITEAENREYNRKRGYTENICVLRPYRRQGLARSLLVQSLHALKERGMEEAALGVDSENVTGALHLYESVGFRVVRKAIIFRKDIPVKRPAENA